MRRPRPRPRAGRAHCSERPHAGGPGGPSPGLCDCSRLAYGAYTGDVGRTATTQSTTISRLYTPTAATKGSHRPSAAGLPCGTGVFTTIPFHTENHLRSSDREGKQRWVGGPRRLTMWPLPTATARPLRLRFR
ncbi:hypothetical protein VULLAG_LOCUS17072 [Vulpes lagopus]